MCRRGQLSPFVHNKSFLLYLQRCIPHDTVWFDLWSPFRVLEQRFMLPILLLPSKQLEFWPYGVLKTYLCTMMSPMISRESCSRIACGMQHKERFRRRPSLVQFQAAYQKYSCNNLIMAFVVSKGYGRLLLWRTSFVTVIPQGLIMPQLE